MAKMEIELTDKQLERVNELEANNISVGEAIDMLFEIKEKALPEIESFNDEMGLLEKVMENTLDVESKAEHLEENYGDAEKSYEMKIQDVKHKISWAKDFFKF